MLFSIAYDIKDADRVQRLLNRVNDLGKNIQYLSNAVFLKPNDNEMNASKIYDDLRTITMDEDRIFISSIEKSKIMGWVSSSVVKWITDIG